jgi:hypothetical protein
MLTITQTVITLGDCWKLHVRPEQVPAGVEPVGTISSRQRPEMALMYVTAVGRYFAQEGWETRPLRQYMVAGTVAYMKQSGLRQADTGTRLPVPEGSAGNSAHCNVPEGCIASLRRLGHGSLQRGIEIAAAMAERILRGEAEIDRA